MGDHLGIHCVVDFFELILNFLKLYYCPPVHAQCTYPTFIVYYCLLYMLLSVACSLEDFLLEYTIMMPLVVNVQGVVESDWHWAQYSMVDCLL